MGTNKFGFPCHNDLDVLIIFKYTVHFQYFIYYVSIFKILYCVSKCYNFYVLISYVDLNIN